MHLFKEYAKEYVESGYSVIPDKFGGKNPLIKGWTNFCTELPSDNDINNWSNSFDEANLAVCLGEASGIIALDFDCEDEEIIKAIEHILPDSPCAKVGSKGWTRFFRYNGEVTSNLKFNDKVVIEILSTDKKTTIPPSVHPNGKSYEWVGKSLLEVNAFSLPDFPPFLFSQIELLLKANFGNTQRTGSKLINGRNDALSKYCSKLIFDSTPLDDALTKLIKFDEENHKTPLFTDLDEGNIRHDEKFTNALSFYSNHLNAFNYKRFKRE